MADIPGMPEPAQGSPLTSPAVRIHAEEVRHIYRLSRAAYPGTLVNAAIVTFALWDVVPAVAIGLWFAAMVVVTAARYMLYREFNARRVRPAQARTWGKYFAVGAAFSGALWGVLGSVLFPDADIVHQFLVIFVIGGMLVAAMVMLSPLPRAYLSFVLAAGAPLAVTIFMQGTMQHAQMGLLTVVFLGVVLGAGPAMARAMRESLRAQFENNELVRQLYEAHGSAREANRRLNEQNAIHRRTEERLLDATRRLEALIESSPLAIFVRDREGRVQTWNDAAERIFGWKEAELLGREIPYLPPDGVDEGRRLRDRVLAGETIAITETTRLNREGRRIEVTFSAAPLQDAAGRVTAYVSMMADISARKRAEQRQNLLSAVTVLLAESQTVEDAVPRIIRTMCEALGWTYGARWVLDRERMVLQCMESWSTSDAAVEAFVAYSASRQHRPGQYSGLLRRVWATGSPVWLADLEKESSLDRRDAARAAGMGAAFAYPIVSGGEFYGVMEFFGPGPRERDEDVVRLAESVSGQIGQFIARRRAEHDLQFVASHDALTGLLNRAMFIQRLQQSIAQAQRYERTLAVLFVDLDGFKSINDTLGHDAGDILLIELAGRLRETLREGDTIGRMGGDEFVVIIEEYAGRPQLVEVARKLLDTVSQPFLLRDQTRQVTASIGIATFGTDGRDVEALLKHADVAMYRAKQGGKNSFQFFGMEDNQSLAERAALESALRNAAGRGELQLYYQPRLSMADERVIGVEAMLRWRHPQQGILGAEDFMQVAEESGLAADIGDWVLRTACAQAVAWREAGLPPMRISVALQMRQLMQDDLIRRVREALHGASLEAAHIEFEMTEQGLLLHQERAARMLQQLKEGGLLLLADGFGTGYSSLALLRRFPFNGLKIDRSLIAQLPGDAGCAAATRAVIAMAHSLGLEATAEGVETREQYDFLESLGCDAVQGGYVCPPVAADSVTRLVLQSGGTIRRGNVQQFRARPAGGLADAE